MEEELSAEEIAKHKRLYFIIGVLLCVFSVVALLLGVYEPWDFGAPGNSVEDIFFGLLVSVVKASLVALIFMHLLHERGLIYRVLLFTFIFFTGLMGLTLFAWSDPIQESFSTLHTLRGVLKFK